MRSELPASLDGAPHVIAGRYEVLGLLGVGGMGAVYKVRDRELDEVVALKMLKREIALAPGAVERFRREVKLARRVTHPNVARTFDLGEHGGERFLTMELVEGESLATRLAREGRLTVSDAVAVASAICDGLDAAHAAGVVHRDLKPDNVLLAPRPDSGGALFRVVITDFGVARAQEAGAAAQTAIPIGTPAYMAPEQVEASKDLDARADVYALGVMLYELLTGRLPFEADSVFAVAAMRLTHDPPDPRDLRPEMPEPLALLVRRCMARKPDDRPATARDVATRLATLTLPTPTRVSSPPGGGDARLGAEKTVAVLPFRGTGAPEDEYLVDGLTDDIIDALSMTPGLRVRPRGVVMPHKHGGGDPREVGRALGVQVVVEGSVRTAPDTLRVSARVLSVEDGFQLWAKRFDGRRADVLRIGDEAARAIADALTVHKPTRAAVATDPIAVDLYLRGRHEFLKFWSTANARAVDLLGQAHERAPDDALIMAAYAAALARQFGLGIASEYSGRAREVAEEAVRRAPGLAEAHLALANVRLHDPDPVAVGAGVTRALALSPLLADAHELRARLLVEVGEPREAIDAAGRALALEPRLGHLRYDVQARARFVLGEWEAADYGDPPDDPARAGVYWIMLTRLTMWSRDKAALLDVAARLASENVTAVPHAALLPFLVREGKVPDAVRELVVARSGQPGITKRMRAFVRQISAEIHGLVGADALEDVRAAVELGLFDLSWLDHCPLLDELRARPEFVELRARVAARAQATLLQLRSDAATVAS